MLDILQFPFMQRALIAGVVLGLVLAYLGIFVVLRRMAFFADGVAHASLAGIALGIVAGVAPLPVALATGVVVAVAMYVLERTTELSSDAVIGILFTAGMALGVVLLSLQPGYQPELVSFLFGNILAVRPLDLVLITGLSSLIILFLVTQERKLILLAFDAGIAHVSGVKAAVYQLILYVMLAVAVVLGIKMLGVVLVSALLIVPVSTAKLFCGSFRSLVTFTILIAEAVIVAGMAFSIGLNVPTGAAIVLTGAVVFLAVFTLTRFKNS